MSGPEIRKFDVTYFAASCDLAETNKKFAESLSADYPILSDSTGSTAQAFGIYNAERKFAQRVTFYIGKDGRILHIDREVKPADHGAAIASRLESLGVAKRP